MQPPLPPRADLSIAASGNPPAPLEIALARTPARVLVGRAGTAYRTPTVLKLREDHAAARDAVQTEIDLRRDFGEEAIARFALFEVHTLVASKAEFLRRPDLGRKLSPGARDRIAANCPAAADLQVVIGDGLSATAVAAQAPALLGPLETMARKRGWSYGRPFVVRYCRVGVMNDVGDLLAPGVLVLLIGERPGLATAESLSAYMAWRPCAGQTDANRNLISNIHGRGVSADEAVRRIFAWAEAYRAIERSGVGVVEGGRGGLNRPALR
jgi:ethanolamine ammonia-lyase small subunit